MAAHDRLAVAGDGEEWLLEVEKKSSGSVEGYQTVSDQRWWPGCNKARHDKLARSIRGAQYVTFLGLLGSLKLWEHCSNACLPQACTLNCSTTTPAHHFKAS